MKFYNIKQQMNSINFVAIFDFFEIKFFFYFESVLKFFKFHHKMGYRIEADSLCSHSNKTKSLVYEIISIFEVKFFYVEGVVNFF